MNFLEKAGLVRQEAPAQAEPAVAAGAAAAEVPSATPTPSPTVARSEAAGLPLDEIYAQAGVTASLYPAERLLRLVDGLSAMDATTRNLAIKAMDAADESWTIADPLADATAKLKALTAHAQTVQASVLQFERETQERMEAMRLRQEEKLGEIRKQMAELEALAARELARSTQEAAAQEANLKSAKEQAARELGEIAHISGRLQSLAVQFGSLAASVTPAQE